MGTKVNWVDLPTSCLALFRLPHPKTANNANGPTQLSVVRYKLPPSTNSTSTPSSGSKYIGEFWCAQFNGAGHGRICCCFCWMVGCAGRGHLGEGIIWILLVGWCGYCRVGIVVREFCPGQCLGEGIEATTSSNNERSPWPVPPRGL